MSRRITTLLIIWLLVAIACGADEPASTSGSAADQQETEDTSNTSVGTATTDDVPEPSTTSPPTGGSTSETTEAPDVTVVPDPVETSPPTTVHSGPVSPITGLPETDLGLMDRRLLAVKVDNHPAARPQSGLERAEAVYELEVEGGITRFMALFHHSDSDWTGPMRSARPTDWTLVQPLNGVLLVSGGQPWIIRRIAANNVPLIGDFGPPLTARWGERAAPHNLYVDTYRARQVADEQGLDRTPPPALFDRGPFSGPDDAIATSIFFDWTSVVDVTWFWDGTQYVRLAGGEPHEWRSRDGAATGQVSTDVLVVLMAERYSACPDGEGSCVPAWDTVGENRAMVFAEGSYVAGTWRRDRAADWFMISDRNGVPITVPPGRLWIMIYPDTAAISW